MWIWTGDPQHAESALPTDIPWLHDEKWRGTHGYMDIAANYMLLKENVLDLTHFGYVHRTTFKILDWDRSPDVKVENNQVEFNLAFSPRPLAPIFAEITGFGAKPIARVNWGRYLSPALQHAGQDFTDPEPAPGSRDKVSFRVLHATTPVNPSRMHYFWFFAFDLPLTEAQIEKVRALTVVGFAEDDAMISAVQQMMELDPEAPSTRKSWSPPIDPPSRRGARSKGSLSNLALAESEVATRAMTPATLDIDPFSREFLAAPHAFHPVLRDAGPVIWLLKYQIWGVARHAEVSAALQNWEVFCSGRGGGLSDFAKEPPWRPPSIILEADPPLHTRTRSVLAKVLSRPALQSLRERMEQQAEQLLDEVLRERSFDAVPALSQAFPLRVFPDAVGVIRDGREHLLPYGDMAFNAFGPRNEIFEQAMKRAGEVSGWIVAQCRRSALDAHGFGAQIYAEADAGVISEEEAGMLVRSLLTAGLDTTIQGIAHSLAAFSNFPDQWRVLREKPSLTRNAFEEAIRFALP